MSRLFARTRSSSGGRSQNAPHHYDQQQQHQQQQHDAYLSLLDPSDNNDSDADGPSKVTTSTINTTTNPTRYCRSKPSQHEIATSSMSSRLWLAAAEGSRPSWTGERPPPRKLVKDHQPGSGRPSFSLELSDSSDGEKDKGLVRRHIARLMEFYRRAEKATAPT